jgi:hypothetical protein
MNFSTNLDPNLAPNLDLDPAPNLDPNLVRNLAPNLDPNLDLYLGLNPVPNLTRDSGLNRLNSRFHMPLCLIALLTQEVEYTTVSTDCNLKYLGIRKGFSVKPF